jgi:hypothetical protein
MGLMDVIVLNSGHQNVLATHVVIFRVMNTSTHTQFNLVKPSGFFTRINTQKFYMVLDVR